MKTFTDIENAVSLFEAKEEEDMTGDTRSGNPLPLPTFREHHKVGLGPLLPPPEFVLCAQELDAERGPFPQGLSAGALSHGVRPRPPAAGQGRAWAGQRLHPDLGRRAGGDAGECQAAAQLSSRLLDRNLGTHQQSCPFSLQLEKRHPLQPHKAGASGMCTPKPCLGTLGRKGAPKISHPPTHIPEESPGPKLVEPAASPTSLAPVQPLRSQRSPSRNFFLTSFTPLPPISDTGLHSYRLLRHKLRTEACKDGRGSALGRWRVVHPLRLMLMHAYC
ncbi:uncharacterized protein [Manis javanica]|uniref:uncharacterized protein n=1 Tax=Manis javanica TaxID=9974 RepID=UPI003C6D209A